jgi:hypothetical protein
MQVGAAPRLSHLQMLEAESIHIFREVAAEFEKPVMLYSIGKDSSVMLRLAQKAFYPGPIPFPAPAHRYRLQVQGDDSRFRDEYTRSSGSSCWSGAMKPPSPPEPIQSRWERAAAADCSRPQRCSTACARMASTLPSAEPAATKKNPAPRSASFPSAIAPANGTPRTSGPSCGTSTTRA